MSQLISFVLAEMIRAVSHAKKARRTKWKIFAKAGLEPTISRLLDWRSNRLCYQVGGCLTVDIYK